MGDDEKYGRRSEKINMGKRRGNGKEKRIKDRMGLSGILSGRKDNSMGSRILGEIGGNG